MDYANGKIYMIEPSCEYLDGEVYYGSTVSTLVKRMSKHRSKTNGCKSKILFEKYGKENIKIVLVKLFPCQSKDELSAEEAKYQRENKCVNKNIAGQTRTREQIREQQKEYYQANSKKIIEKQKEHYQANREQNSEYQKAYYQTNRDKINVRQRLRRAENKSKSNV
jgi:hypothetical protein